MDDRDLEARLRDRLHARFDAAEPSGDLGASVAQLFATEARRVGWASLRSRQFQLGWSVVALAAVAAIAIVAANLRGPLGPGAIHGSPTPTTFVPSPQPPQRYFVVMSRLVGEPAKADADLASDLLGARISALGVSNFSGYADYGIVYSLPLGGPSDEAIRDVLRAIGDVKFVPLPAADYGDGRLVAEPGKPLPKEEPALFGWESIESAARKAAEPPTTTIALKAPAAQAFAEYMTAHVGGRFAVVIDGIVAVAPTIQSPVSGGEVEITAGADDPALFTRASAILVSGMLPEAWRGADVPVIIPEDAAAAAALRRFPDTTAGAGQLDVVQDGARWRAVWTVTLHGNLDAIDVKLDAVTGDLISAP